MERKARCQCGSLRATVSGEPTIVVACHCKACQRRTGAVIGTTAFFNKSQVRVEGPKKTYTRDIEGVQRKVRFHFCPTCGSSVYWHLDLRPDHYGIAVGAFTDPDFPPPTQSVWEQTKHSWINLPEGVRHFPKTHLATCLWCSRACDTSRARLHSSAEDHSRLNRRSCVPFDVRSDPKATDADIAASRQGSLDTRAP
jgi:hypothetical protein